MVKKNDKHTVEDAVAASLILKKGIDQEMWTFRLAILILVLLILSMTCGLLEVEDRSEPRVYGGDESQRRRPPT